MFGESHLAIIMGRRNSKTKSGLQSLQYVFTNSKSSRVDAGVNYTLDYIQKTNLCNREGNHLRRYYTAWEGLRPKGSGTASLLGSKASLYSVSKVVRHDGSFQYTPLG